MSDETETLEKEKDAEEMSQLLAMEAEEKQAKAAVAVEEPATPSPEPTPSQAPEAVQVEPAPVTPNPSQPEQAQPATGKDDPMEWAKRKGYKSPEDMARELLKKDQDYHQSKQKEREAAQQPPAPPAWQPTPQMGYGYAPQPNYAPQPSRMNPRDLAPYYPQLNPEDVERVMPLVMDAAEVISKRNMAQLEQRFGAQFGEIQRSTARNNELMNLMQDPAFRNEAVQREIHAVLDSKPNLFQRSDAYTAAFNEALANMARKQLQQGAPSEQINPSNKPPFTAGGGNGSANTSPLVITSQIFSSWTDDQQDAYMKSNGKIVPKK